MSSLSTFSNHHRWPPSILSAILIITSLIPATTTKQTDIQVECNEFRTNQNLTIKTVSLTKDCLYLYTGNHLICLPPAASNWALRRVMLFDEFKAPDGMSPQVLGKLEHIDWLYPTLLNWSIIEEGVEGELIRLEFGPDNENQFTATYLYSKNLTTEDGNLPFVYAYEFPAPLSSAPSGESFTNEWELVWQPLQTEMTDLPGESLRYVMVIRHQTCFDTGFYLSISSPDNRTLTWYRAFTGTNDCSGNTGNPLRLPHSYRPLFPSEPLEGVYYKPMYRHFGYILRTPKEMRFHLLDGHHKVAHLFATPARLNYNAKILGPFRLTTIKLEDYFICTEKELDYVTPAPDVPLPTGSSWPEGDDESFLGFKWWWAAIGVGVVAALLLIAFAVLLVVKRRRQRQKRALAEKQRQNKRQKKASPLTTKSTNIKNTSKSSTSTTTPVKAKNVTPADSPKQRKVAVESPKRDKVASPGQKAKRGKNQQSPLPKR